MKRTVFGGLVPGVVLCMLAGPAIADLTLSIVPASQTVNVGEFVDVEVSISGLSDFAADSLGGFDIDVLVDGSIVAFDSATFGDSVLGDQLDLFGFGFNPLGASAFAGGVNIFELSLDSPFDLEDFQVGAFTLATLSFEAVDLGTSALTFSLAPSTGLGDAWGGALAPITVESGEITVIPAPGAALLGLIGLGMIRLVRAR